MRLETVVMASVMKEVNCSMASSRLFSSTSMRCCSNLLEAICSKRTQRDCLECSCSFSATAFDWCS